MERCVAANLVLSCTVMERCVAANFVLSCTVMERCVTVMERCVAANLVLSCTMIERCIAANLVLSSTASTTTRFHTAKCYGMMIISGRVISNIKIQTKIGRCLASSNITLCYI
jgi:hypothetical protein